MIYCFNHTGNLALSDFLLATTILPLSIFDECLGHWIFGEFVCNTWLMMDVLYCTASLWNICVIAFDRFTATLYPMWYREMKSAKQAGIYVALVGGKVYLILGYANGGALNAILGATKD